MEPKDLVKVWDAPDHSKLTSKQWSIRLPILVAGKILALCELYPRKTKTEIIGDLLATAIDQVENALPSTKGECLGPGPENLMLFEEQGMKRTFFSLTEKHLRELEKEAGISEPMELSPPAIAEEE